MGCYQPGFSDFGQCCSCFNSPECAIIFSAIVGLLIVQILDEDTLGRAGNVVLNIGQMMVTAAEFCGK